jgi:hypothetical protein
LCRYGGAAKKLHYLNPAPLKQISERWIDKHKEACLRALTDLTKGLDGLKPEAD